MEGSRLYVGNLNYEVDNKTLEKLFSGYGSVKFVKVIEGKGFGFVEMSSSEEAEKAKKELNGTNLKGRELKIDAARPYQKRPRYNFRKYKME